MLVLSQVCPQLLVKLALMSRVGAMPGRTLFERRVAVRSLVHREKLSADCHWICETLAAADCLLLKIAEKQG